MTRGKHWIGLGLQEVAEEMENLRGRTLSEWQGWANEIKGLRACRIGNSKKYGLPPNFLTRRNAELARHTDKGLP